MPQLAQPITATGTELHLSTPFATRPSHLLIGEEVVEVQGYARLSMRHPPDPLRLYVSRASSGVAASHSAGATVTAVVPTYGNQPLDSNDGGGGPSPAPMPGEPGQQGPAGPPGEAGPEGPAGVQGPTGSTGPAGPKGDAGAAGADGLQGPPGADGSIGPSGAQGPPGADGEDGAAGAAGATGQAGSQGIQGVKGDKGDTGNTGSTGPPGAASTVPGPTGPPGADGAAGQTGQTGQTGQQGIQGIQGVPGVAPAKVFATLANGSTAMAFGTNDVVKVAPTTNATYTTTVPAAGAAVMLLVGPTIGTTSRTITFGTGFKPTTTLATGTTASRIFVIEWISDGTNLYEASRTVAIVA